MKGHSATLLIFSIVVIAGIITILNSYTERYTISGKITNTTLYAKGLNPYTRVTLQGGNTISFTGHLLFEIGTKYEISYNKSGLIWELLGDEALNTVEHIKIIS